MPKFKEGPRIYNLFPRLVGKMDKWVEHFQRIKKLGFNWVYINPFHYPGFSGSLYAPKDYYDFNPVFITNGSEIPPMKQLQETISQAKENKLKIIMDLVINHTAKDHPFTRIHSDWYLKDDKGNIKSPGAWDNGRWIEWGDLAEINNEHSPDRENLWNYWEELILFYIEKGIDGFRADAAYLIPAELWQKLITSAKKVNPEITFFAENLGCTPKQTLALTNAGFDYIFNSSKWWNYTDPWLMEQYNQTKNLCPSISFPESHDTIRINEELHNNMPAIIQKTIFAGFFSSGWMIPIGYEYGFKKKTDVVHTQPEDWENENYNLENLIKTINNTKKKYEIFNEDSDIILLNSDNPNLLVLQQTSKSQKEKVLMIINKNIYGQERFYSQSLTNLLMVKDSTLIIDLSPKNQIEQIQPNHFEYYLNNAEIKILYCKS